MRLIKQVSIAIFVALFASAFVIKSFAWNAGAWDTSGSWGNYGYTPCPANSSCVFNNPIVFPNPFTPTPTTYSYNTVTITVPSTSGNGLTIGVYSSDLNPSLYYNKFQILPSVNSFSEQGFLFSLMRMGNLVQFAINNSGGTIFLTPTSNAGFVEFNYGGHPLELMNSNRNGNSFIYIDNTLSFTVTANDSPNTGIGITMATNAGLGLSTLTQNNAIMNTGPIYPRNPANVAQTLTQPTIQPVYDNNLAGLSYTGWSATGSGNLSSGVLTVNLGLPFDNVNAYKCSANYDGVPTTVAGFLAITKNSGSQFTITSVNSTGGTNTTDVNKVQWTCIGY